MLDEKHHQQISGLFDGKGWASGHGCEDGGCVFVLNYEQNNQLSSFK